MGRGLTLGLGEVVVSVEMKSKIAEQADLDVLEARSQLARIWLRPTNLKSPFVRRHYVACCLQQLYQFLSCLDMVFKSGAL